MRVNNKEEVTAQGQETRPEERVHFPSAAVHIQAFPLAKEGLGATDDVAALERFRACEVSVAAHGERVAVHLNNAVEHVALRTYLSQDNVVHLHLVRAGHQHHAVSVALNHRAHAPAAHSESYDAALVYHRLDFGDDNLVGYVALQFHRELYLAAAHHPVTRPCGILIGQALHVVSLGHTANATDGLADSIIRGLIPNHRGATAQDAGESLQRL